MSDIQEKILELMDLFDDDEVTTANKIPRPQSSLDKEAFDDFNIRNPLAGGGRIELRRGSKPLYQNVEGQPHIKRHPVSKKYLVTRSVMRDGKKTPQYKGNINTLNEAIKIRDAFVEDLPSETTAQTNIRTKKAKGVLDVKELQKASKFFYKRGEISSPNYLDLKGAELRKIYDNVSGGATPGKFSKDTQYKPLKKSQQNKILKQFPDADFELYKFGFNPKSDAQNFNVVKEFVKRGYKPAFYNVKNLPKKTQDIIIEAFGKEATDSGIDLKFGLGRKFGITPKENKQLYTTIRNFVENSSREYPYAFSLDKSENWIIAQMARASKNNSRYDVITNKNGKIIGAIEDGVEYYHANSKIGNVITNHPEAKKISKFVSIAKNAKASIPQSLIKMFPKGFDRNLLRSDRAYNDLLQWLDNSKGRRVTANAIQVHHGGEGGVTGNPALAKDLQLLTRQDNLTAEVIKNQILKNDFSRVQELKDKGIRLNVGGKEYGAGFETAQQGIKRIETQTGAQLREKLKADPKLKDFEKFLKKDISQSLLKLASTVTDRCAIGNADGGRIGYSLGSESCLKIGKQALNNGIKNGFQKGSQQALLATQIINAGKGLKNMASIRGLLGPQATLLFAATEAGLIGADILTKGKTLKEAVADSLINPALGPKLKQDSKKLFVERLKNLGVSDQEIGKGLMFDRMVEDVNTLDDLIQRRSIADQKVEQSKKLYPAAVDKEEREIPGVGGFKFDKPFLSIPDVRDKRKKEASDIAMDIQDIYRTRDRNVLDLFEGKFQKPETQEIFEQAAAQKQALEGLAAADQARAVAKNIYGKFIQGPRSREKMDELRSRYFDMALEDANPALFSPIQRAGGFTSGFADGGLSGGDKSGPPPESGPTPHGLPGILKRVKNI